MIKYALLCGSGHRFEAWFRSSSVFEHQSSVGEIACPACGDTSVARALMAPAVVTRRGRARPVAEEAPRAPRSGGVPPTATGAPPGAATGLEGEVIPPGARTERMAGGALDQRQRMLLETLREVRRQVIEHGTDVGDAFPEEARKIHYGEAPERGIYGQATLSDARDLAEEGISVLPLPILPEDQN